MRLRYALFFAVTVVLFQAEGQQSIAPAETQKGEVAPADAALTFTVASVKPAVLPTAGGRAGGVRALNEPGRLHFPATTLKALFLFAYNVKDFQLAGPAWIGDQRFAVDATMPTNTTEDQTRAMLRNLLAERFGVQAHLETRSLPIYSLVVAKNGLRIPNTPEPKAKQLRNSAFATDGFPFVPPELTGVTMFVINGQAKVTAQQATMGELAAQLEKMLGVPVANETRLTAKFDFTLKFSPDGLKGPNGTPIPATPSDATAGVIAGEPLKDIFSTLPEIGLRLEQQRGSVKVIVIDHVEKAPTEN